MISCVRSAGDWGYLLGALGTILEGLQAIGDAFWELWVAFWRVCGGFWGRLRQLLEGLGGVLEGHWGPARLRMPTWIPKCGQRGELGGTNAPMESNLGSSRRPMEPTWILHGPEKMRKETQEKAKNGSKSDLTAKMHETENKQKT